jgi:ribonuclease R
VPLLVQPADIAGRVDLRSTPLVTIDGEDAKDFDDAVWCEPNKDGFRLIVAIADVSHYVRPGTPLDDEAQLRATSVYFPGFVVPMLPETLSNGICSLMPTVDRLCFVCDMQVGRDGIVTSSEFYEAVMYSHARLTYTDVWNAVGEGIPEGYCDCDGAAENECGGLPQVRLHQLQVRTRRAKRGAISSRTASALRAGQRRGQPGRHDPAQRPHKLIEECMIAASIELRCTAASGAVPPATRSKYADLEEFLKEFQLRMPPWAKVKPKDFRAMLEKIRERPDATLLESVILRSQSLAVYAPENIGHFGLALEAYAHFTSPIRRYPDLLVHRGIKHARPARAGHLHVFAHEMAALSLQCSGARAVPTSQRRSTTLSRGMDGNPRRQGVRRHHQRRTSFGLLSS